MKRTTLIGRNRPALKTAKSSIAEDSGSNGNGNGNGNGTHVATLPAVAERLEGQPPIMEFLAAPKAKDPQLSKTMLYTVLVALKKGDFTARLPLDLSDMDGKIADAFNEVVELNQRMA
jgi:methyl-accepting chemotaxis protein